MINLSYAVLKTAGLPINNKLIFFLIKEDHHNKRCFFKHRTNELFSAAALFTNLNSSQAQNTTAVRCLFNPNRLIYGYITFVSDRHSGLPASETTII